ncbi:ion transporter [Flavobacteriaceae bacterium]|nr:ion transporter [Flavobacteriaceae bacterium]MDB4767990.1 ion transporter [Flavobacteriaceae bacterium]
MGKAFDVLLAILILFSVLIVMLESVASIDLKYHKLLLGFEWGITLFFTAEYLARVVSIEKPKKYIFSFYGIIDLLATIPLYLSYILAGSQVLLALRAFRLLRIFRILKLVSFLGEASVLKQALKDSRNKILVFIYVVLILCVIMGTFMYLIEDNESGFTSIPRSIYWTIVTLTTVGYGDIAPQTPLGQFVASMIMILGYGIIAVPTGIVTVAINKNKNTAITTNTQSCQNCSSEGHKDGAVFCFNCGAKL